MRGLGRGGFLCNPACRADNIEEQKHSFVSLNIAKGGAFFFFLFFFFNLWT
ncbi:unnamed protein product [Staurois parvus]|uniref:Uncharacterized protein n=1 Tax=Staurois parvus TaxID=386267 RepID=A0ABN9C487_9NEOB|nr:unnamed protein product [Staurois parvus]